MSEITQLGYVGFRVSDLERWRNFSTKVLGMTMAETYPDGGFASAMDRHKYRFLFEAGPEDDLCLLGFETETTDDLECVVERLQLAGVAVERGKAADLDRREVGGLVRFREPGGLLCELVCDPPILPTAVHLPKIPGGFVADDMGFGHCAIRADDVDESQRFFCDLLGFKPSDRISLKAKGYDVDVRFLHINRRHHSIALGLGLPKHIHHFMLQLKTLDDVGKALDRALRFGCKLQKQLGRHPNDKMVTFYAETPSGFEVEIGYGGREITADWQYHEYDTISDWGHGFS